MELHFKPIQLHLSWLFLCSHSHSLDWKVSAGENCACQPNYGSIQQVLLADALVGWEDPKVAFVPVSINIYFSSLHYICVYSCICFSCNLSVVLHTIGCVAASLCHIYICNTNLLCVTHPLVIGRKMDKLICCGTAKLNTAWALSAVISAI